MIKLDSRTIEGKRRERKRLLGYLTFPWSLHIQTLHPETLVEQLL